jgi:cytochrome oxidase assembly protein ShyY1
MEDMQIKFLILIILVFLITAGFCLLIWQQTKRFEKKALLAKQRQKEYEKELRFKMQEEKRAQKEKIASTVNDERTFE